VIDSHYDVIGQFGAYIFVFYLDRRSLVSSRVVGASIHRARRIFRLNKNDTKGKRQTQQERERESYRAQTTATKKEIDREKIRQRIHYRKTTMVTE
jgi:hypothetical protein